MKPSRNRFPYVYMLLPFILGVSLGCNRNEPDGESTDAAKLSSGGEIAQYPAPTFKLSAETKGALFTWVDDDGSFQLAESVEEMPAARRNPVRVVVEGHSPGGGDYVYVTDLSRGISDAPVRAMSRTEWENLGKTARDKTVAELSPPPVDDSSSPQALGVDAIVYGADWCKPCHLAEDYLKKKGARVVKKDIEEDPSAGQEMRSKLQRAGMNGSSIPVLDVGGTILRGFSAGAIDAALSRAKTK